MVDTIYEKQFGALSLMQGGISAMLARAYGPGSYRELVKPAETVIEHLVRLTWLEEVSGSVEEPGLKLTDLGRALLRDKKGRFRPMRMSALWSWGRPSGISDADRSAQRRRSWSPRRSIFKARRSPYDCRKHSADAASRIGKAAEQQRGRLDAGISRQLQPCAPRRGQASIGLHDRVLIADDGELVMTLGTSINGVGRTTTVMTPMTPKARAALQEEYAQLWEEAELMGPPVEDEQEDQGDQDAEGDQDDQDAEGDHGEDE